MVHAKDSIPLIIDCTDANTRTNVDLFAVQSCDLICGIGMIPARRIVYEDTKLLQGGRGGREICWRRGSGGLTAHICYALVGFSHLLMLHRARGGKAV